MRSQDRGTPGLPREQKQPNPKQRLPSPGTQPAELPAELTQRRCCGKAARHPGSPPLPARPRCPGLRGSTRTSPARQVPASLTAALPRRLSAGELAALAQALEK